MIGFFDRLAKVQFALRHAGSVGWLAANHLIHLSHSHCCSNHQEHTMEGVGTARMDLHINRQRNLEDQSAGMKKREKRSCELQHARAEGELKERENS